MTTEEKLDEIGAAAMPDRPWAFRYVQEVKAELAAMRDRAEAAEAERDRLIGELDA